MTRDKHICSLSYSIAHTEHHIVCNFCGTINKAYDVDEYGAGEQFYKEGWRAGSINVYCQKCAKKKLKNKK